MGIAVIIAMVSAVPVLILLGLMPAYIRHWFRCKDARWSQTESDRIWRAADEKDGREFKPRVLNLYHGYWQKHSVIGYALPLSFIYTALLAALVYTTFVMPERAIAAYCAIAVDVMLFTGIQRRWVIRSAVILANALVDNGVARTDDDRDIPPAPTRSSRAARRYYYGWGMRKHGDVGNRWQMWRACDRFRYAYDWLPWLIERVPWLVTLVVARLRLVPPVAGAVLNGLAWPVMLFYHIIRGSWLIRHFNRAVRPWWRSKEFTYDQYGQRTEVIPAWPADTTKPASPAAPAAD